MTTSRVIVARKTGFSSAAIRDPSYAFVGGVKGFWIEAADLSKLWKDTAGTSAVTTVGDSVARIDDKSGNGYSWQQSTSGSRPTYGVDGGGYPYLNFDGSNDYLGTTAVVDLTGSDKCTIILALERLSSSNQQIAMYNGYGLGHGWAHYASIGGGGEGPGYACSGGANGYKYVGDNTSGVGKYLASVRIDKSQSTLDATLDYRVNGRRYNLFRTGGSNPGSGNFGSHTNYLGAYSGAVSPCPMHFYFAMCVQGLVSDADLAGYENYAFSKFGLV